MNFTHDCGDSSNDDDDDEDDDLSARFRQDGR